MTPAVQSTHQKIASKTPSDTDEGQLSPVPVGQLFAEQLYPRLAACKHFSLDDPKGRPAQLTRALESPQVRAIAWGHLENNGLQAIGTQPQRHALVAGLLPYLSQDVGACWPAFVAMAAGAARSQDMELYRLLGESAVRQELPGAVVADLAGPFATLSTHNAGADRWLKPWIEVFSNRGNSELFDSLVDELLNRLERGDRSSYDHLLAVLCSAPSAGAVRALARGLTSAQVKPSDSSLDRSVGHVLAVYLKQTLLMTPMSLAMQLFHRDSVAVMLLSGAFTAAMAGIVGTIFELRSSAVKALRRSQQEASSEQGAPFLYFAERVYEKLSKLQGSIPESQQLLKEMETHPSFARHIEKWRGSFQSA
jgi:hypothetical protein